jgi:hypothetical protein
MVDSLEDNVARLQEPLGKPDRLRCQQYLKLLLSCSGACRGLGDMSRAPGQLRLLHDAPTLRRGLVGSSRRSIDTAGGTGLRNGMAHRRLAWSAFGPVVYRSWVKQ